MFQVRRFWLTIAAAALLSAACSSPAAPSAPRQPASPTAAPATSTAAPGSTAPAGGAAATATTAPTGGGAGDPARGQASFQSAGCVACHGDRAQGNVFPGAAKLSSTALTCDQIRTQVRTPKDPTKGMPGFSTGQLSDAAVNDICSWVKSIP